MSEETYTLEVTGEQAHQLAVWLSLLAQDAQDGDNELREDMEMLAPVGQQCAEIAERAGEWEE